MMAVEKLSTLKMCEFIWMRIGNVLDFIIVNSTFIC